ncbi:hypothetical protein CVT24_008767 [Panaeolus cyanescens]|uniref:Uncharacterized protein n=1 Tax=Panaeolus cyanescens TaxID=181874 RepID=A0A409VET1_9AGAR|nr:hypothetical protein CVT24_008767 [Panaeolus cyanescens]
MQYGHMGIQERRDPNLDNSSSNFHQNGLNQALNTHLAAGLQQQQQQSYSRPNEYRNPSTSPPTLTQQAQAAASSSHSPLTFANVPGGTTSPAIKRKQVDNLTAQAAKRRRDTVGGEDDGGFDMDGSGGGAKHWSDDEKTKLFNWLMGVGQEEHWAALRATKNSCLRECALDVFGGKKTYQALKGCYERNFNLFKQIYAFESSQGGLSSLSALSENDRLREYDRRLQLARKNGTDVGNITARVIDHWHRVGWYDLFYRRWHGDPATTRPSQGRNAAGPSAALGAAEDVDDDDAPLDFSDQQLLNGMGTHDRQPQVPQQQQPQQHVYINPQSLRENPLSQPQPPPITAPQAQPQNVTAMRQAQQQQQQPPPPPTILSSGIPGLSAPPIGTNGLGSAGVGASTSSAPGIGNVPVGNQPDPTMINLPLTHELISRCLHYLGLQSQVAQEKLEYLRRKEAREVNELNAKKDMEKAAQSRNKTEKAIEVINNPNAEATLKAAATEYLRKMFLQQD